MSDETAVAANQYLTFSLGPEWFALGIASVREILDEKNITLLPQAPDFMRGVINLRGRAVPVIDLRRKFGMSRTQMTVSTSVIITEVLLGEEMAVLGALADAVQEVVELLPDEILPPPATGTIIEARFIKGVGKCDGRFVHILDIDRIFSIAELGPAAGYKAKDKEPKAQ